MKFVYVLISDEGDYYTEEVLVSMLSLKKHNPESNIVLVTDTATKLSLWKRESFVCETATEIIEVDIPERFNKKCRSRFLKTSLPEYIKDNFLYIDSDTVINGNLSDIEKYEYDIGAVYDRNENGECNDYMRLRLNNAGIKDIDQLVFYNGGVIFSRNTKRAKKFFNDWHQLWLQFYKNYGVEIDQISLLKANQLNNNIIQLLPGYYNCQLTFENSIKFLSKARILHYIADFKNYKCFPMEEPDILLEIRKNGITPHINDIINNPVEIFLKDKFIISSKEKKSYDNMTVVLGKELARYYPFTNRLAFWGLKIWAFARFIRSKLK